MSETKARGSILYEVLILVLAAALIGSILYPKKVREDEKMHTALGRYRMEQLQLAGLQYQKYNGAYTDTVSQIFEFIRTSDEYSHYVDSIVVGGLDSVVTKIKEFEDRQNVILAALPSATDSTMIDSLTELQLSLKLDARQLAGHVEFVHDRMRNLPNMPIDPLKAIFVIVDSKQFTLNMDIVRNSIESGKLDEAEAACADVLAVFESAIGDFEHVKGELPSATGPGLDSLVFCPTTNKPFRMVHIDTAIVKYLNIYSPIDSMDIAMAEDNFLLSTIGGLKLENHGMIESGERSWEVR